MKFKNIRTPKPSKDQDYPVRVGNVYKVHGGRGGPRYQVVVGLPKDQDGNQSTCVLLIFNARGEVTNSTRYGRWALARKCPDGFCKEIENLNLTIIWTEYKS